MLTHCAALHRPTTVQQTQSIVAARVVAATVPWDVADWRNWCASSTRTATGFLQRTTLVHKVKKWTKKKGLKLLKRMNKDLRKRTVFTLRKGVRLLKRKKPMK